MGDRILRNAHARSRENAPRTTKPERFVAMSRPILSADRRRGLPLCRSAMDDHIDRHLPDQKRKPSKEDDAASNVQTNHGLIMAHINGQEINEIPDREYEYATVYTEVASLQEYRNAAVKTHNDYIDEMLAVCQGEWNEDEFESPDEEIEHLETMRVFAAASVTECDREYEGLLALIQEAA